MSIAPAITAAMAAVAADIPLEVISVTDGATTRSIAGSWQPLDSEGGAPQRGNPDRGIQPMADVRFYTGDRTLPWTEQQATEGNLFATRKGREYAVVEWIDRDAFTRIGLDLRLV